MKTALFLGLVVSAVTLTINPAAYAGDTTPEVRTVMCKVDSVPFARAVRKRIYQEMAQYPNIQVLGVYVSVRRESIVTKQKPTTDWATGLALGNLGDPSAPLIVGGNLEVDPIAEQCTVPVTVNVRILELMAGSRMDRRTVATMQLPGVYR